MANFLDNCSHLTEHFAQTVGRGGVLWSIIRDLKQDNAAAVTLLLSLCLLIMRMRKRWDDHMVNQQSEAAEKDVEGLMKMAEASSSWK